MDITEFHQLLVMQSGDDAFRPRLTVEQWKVIQGYLSLQQLRAGEMLIRQGDSDRTVYFLLQGALSIFLTGAKHAGPLATIRPGAIVGEPAMFGSILRMANTEAVMPSAVFALKGQRFEELGQRQPAIALELMRAAGAVMAQRMRTNLTHI